MLKSHMKLIAFAGGSGKRFWPLGKISKPKQFLPLFDKKSTFELTFERLIPIYGLYNIFVSTNERYIPMVKSTVPALPTTNIIPEPAMRDVGPAVGLALIKLKKLKIKEPIALLWTDHYIKDVEKYQQALKFAEETVLKQTADFVLLGEDPTFPAQNLGWITIGDKLTDSTYKLAGFEYRPPKEQAEKLFKTKTGLWNTAYLVSTVDKMLAMYKKYATDLYNELLRIYKYLDTPKEAEILQKIYPKVPKIHFDHIIPYNLMNQKTVVLKTKMGWSDPGSLYTYKQTLAEDNKNYIEGQVYTEGLTDSMVINKEPNKLLVTYDLDGMIIVNTKDALLVISKDKVKKLSDIVTKLQKNRKLSKFVD